MKYCTCCKKIRNTRERTKKWFEDNNITYTYTCCERCLSPLLLDKEPDFDTHIKISKKDKKAEKRFNQRQYRVT